VWSQESGCRLQRDARPTYLRTKLLSLPVCTNVIALSRTVAGYSARTSVCCRGAPSGAGPVARCLISLSALVLLLLSCNLRAASSPQGYAVRLCQLTFACRALIVPFGPLSRLIHFA